MKNNLRKILFLLFILSFISCAEKFKKPSNMEVFKYNESAGIKTLDPAFARDQAIIWGTNQIFEGLTQLDSNLNVIPSLAKSWKINDSATHYRFIIRDDVYFHNHDLFSSKEDRKCTAYDIEYSLLRVLNPQTLSPGAVWLSHLLKTDSNNNYSIYARNDTILDIYLKQAFSPFLGRLSMKYFSAVPKIIVEKYGKDFGRNPIGTGPFYLKTWKEGVKMVLLKNTDYWEKENGVQLPYLDGVSISFIIDKQSVFLEFVKGNIDFISGIDASYKDELLTADGQLNPKYKGKINMRTNPYLNTEYLGFMMDSTKAGMKNSPLNNKKIRQAINFGFNRKDMMKYLRNNIGYPGIYGMVPLGLPGFDKNQKEYYSYNPSKSLELLESAGYPFGKGLPPITLSTTAAYVDLSRFLQSQLSEIGINIKINVDQAASLRSMVADSKIPFFRASWIADYADAENYLALFYSKNFSPNGSNYTHFSNEEFDLLYKKARTITNDSIRNELYKEMNRIVMDEAAVIILYYDQVLRFSQKNIKNLGVNAMNLLNLKTVRKE